MHKVFVALVTPFLENQEIDEQALRNLVQRLLQEKVDGLVVCGTTAETPTLTIVEQRKILEIVLEEVKETPDVEVWVGCGSNHTLSTSKTCQELEAYPIQGVMLCTPYYNKPSQEGIYEHFSYIARNTSLYIMLYNIPSRCGVEITYNTFERLLNEYDNIVACKQASNDLETIKKLKQKYMNIKFYSGEDAMLDEAMDAGMDGIISVMAHVNLVEMKQFLENGRKDNDARKRLKRQAELLFCEPSPACVKYVLSKRKEMHNILRLPMVPVSEDGKRKIEESNLF